jgi:hypothetical protein
LAVDVNVAVNVVVDEGVGFISPFDFHVKDLIC